MAENIPTDSIFATFEGGPKYGLEQYQQYLGDLGQARQQLPALIEQERGLLASQYGAAQRAIQEGQRQGMRSMAQEAARGMAASMGQAGAMPVGGGSAATMRQTGRTFGQGAAQFAQEAAQRAAELEERSLADRRGLLGQERSLYAEVLPAISLAQAEGVGTMADIQRAPQDELVWIMGEVGAIEDNNYWDSDRAIRLNSLIGTLTPGSPARRYAERQLFGYGYTYSPLGPQDSGGPDIYFGGEQAAFEDYMAGQNE